ncbi:MAG: TIGR02300 family protein [Commensalibacter sp.]|nr:TIGR02300 family protein [Commensalibacter sp.]
MVKAELGTKRVCCSCGIRFYDLNKMPPVCPKCGTEQPIELPRGRPPEEEDNSMNNNQLNPKIMDDDLDTDLVEDDDVDAAIEDASDLEDDDTIDSEIEVIKTKDDDNDS